MGKQIITVILFFFMVFCVTANAKDKLTTTYRTDINKDGKKELLVHDYYGGSGAVGELRIYNSTNQCIFKDRVEGDIYLWDPNKQAPALVPEFFPDLNKDGLPEILIGYRGHGYNIAQVDEPWWFDVYSWNGRKYVLANIQFPLFFKDRLKWYQTYKKEKGGCDSIEKFISLAQKFAAGNLSRQ